MPSTKTPLSDDLSILVVSCDKMHIVWETFYTLLQKFWPEFDGKIYNYSETKKTTFKDVININSQLPKEAKYWSEGFKFALKNIKSKYVILLLEDFFLNRKVKHSEVIEQLEFLKKNPSIKCLRLVPIPPADIPVNDMIGKVSLKAPYRISTMAAIWDREYLLEIIKDGESPWEFELNGSTRSKSNKGEIWAVLRKPNEERILTYHNALIRGKLTLQAKNFLNKHKIKFNPQIPINSKIEEFYWFGAPNWLKIGLDYTNKNIFQYMWKNKL